jgi:hypothetical protein
MLEKKPSQSIMTELLGQSLYEVWQALCTAINKKYDMEQLWNTGGKNWTYEYKYRRGGKTLCSLYEIIGYQKKTQPKITISVFALFLKSIL